MNNAPSHLAIIPLTLAQANTYVKLWHRHHKEARGYRYALGAVSKGAVVGAVIVGRPVCRSVDQYRVAEVYRLVTDGTPNACSFLYSAAARVAREMGMASIQTYILEDEIGASLRAAGWTFDGMTAGGDWNHSASNAGKRRTDQPMCPKQRWCKQLETRVPDALSGFQFAAPR